MSEVWVTVAALTVLTAVEKAAGPVLLGTRELPALVLRVIALLAPALLAALVVVGTFTAGDGDLELDARAAGLGAAAGAIALTRRSLLAAALAAAVVAAVVRALS